MAKSSKVEKMTNAGTPKSGRTLFNQGIFQEGVGGESETDNEQSYQYTFVEIDKINVSEEELEYPNALKRSVEDRMIQPVILSQDFVMKERGGRKFKSKNGRYNIVDGNKRIDILKKAGTEKVSALVLPFDVSQDEIDKIKQTTNEDKQEGFKKVVKDVTETLDEEITYCYRYESINVDMEDVVERENKYTMQQSEIDELEHSIYNLGLLQPIVVLPIMNQRTMKVQYEIQSGHKRTRAIRQLIKHAEEGLYPGNKEVILESFKTIPALLIPMGSNPKDVEKIYHETNMLSRHMTIDDCFRVIESFDFLPSRPTTKEEYVHFREEYPVMNDLVIKTKDQLKRYGFQDWKSSKTAKFLNVYYYGSDLAVDVFTNISDYNLSQKEIYWIVVTYKDFNEREKQDQIIKAAIEDKSTLRELMAEKTVRRKWTDYTVKKVSEGLVRQKGTFERYVAYSLTGKANQDEKDKAKKLINETRALLVKLERAIDDVETKE